jgi:hypothetical protein
MFYNYDFFQCGRNLKNMKSFLGISAACAITLLLVTVPARIGFTEESLLYDRQLLRFETGVVYDPESGLEWYAGPDRSTSWEEAKNWVTSLDAFGGRWRMPTMDELDTLHRVGDAANNITYLLYNSGYWIWSGHTEASSAKWVFSFSYGGEGWNGQAPADGGRALAVRERQND